MQVTIYGLGVNIPKEWQVKLSSRSNYYVGVLSFVSPTAGSIDLAWSPLDEFKSKFSTPEEYFDNQFKRLREEEEKKKVLELNIEKRAWTMIPDHPASFHKVTYFTKHAFGKRIFRKIVGLGVYCKKSDRFIIMYNEYEGSDEKIKPMPDDVILSIMESLRCLCDEE